MSCVTRTMGAVLGFALCGAASAQVLIDATTNNGSFELAGGVVQTTKIVEWDGDPDVDNWTEWAGVSGASGDSGVEMTGNASDGDMVAFLQPNNAVYNLTSYVVQEGDIFNFSWDHLLRNSSHTVSLVYDDGGTITALAGTEVTSTTEGANYQLVNFEVTAGSPMIGNAVGLGVINNNSNWPEVDNFFLSVNEEIVVGDVNGDGNVDEIDYGIIRDNFRIAVETQGEGDLNGDGMVDFDDFIQWRENATPAALALLGFASVPEPSACLLAISAAAVAAGGRRRR